MAPVVTMLTSSTSLQRVQPFQARPRHRFLRVRGSAAALEAPPVLAAPAAEAVKRSRNVSRRFAEQLAKVPGKEESLPPLDAIRLALGTSTTKFAETVEASAIALATPPPSMLQAWLQWMGGRAGWPVHAGMLLLCQRCWPARPLLLLRHRRPACVTYAYHSSH